MTRRTQNDPILSGAHIQDQLFKNKMALPNEHDIDAQLFSDIGKAAGEKPRGWSALAAGISKGFEYGAKSKGNEKRQKESDKYEKVMNYFAEVNNAAAERNEWYEKREMARQEFLPQVLAYASSIDRLDPQSQRIMAQNILDGYGKALGEDFKLQSIDGANPFIVTIGTKKGNQVFDVRSLFAGDEVMQQQLAMKMPEYQEKLQEERNLKQQQLALKQEELDRKYPQGGDESGIDEQGNSYVPLSGLEKGARKEFQVKVMKDLNNIPVNEGAIKTINDMRQIFEKYPNISDKFVNILESEEKGTLSYLIKRWALNKDELAAVERLRKSAADLNLSTILGVPGKSATDLLKREIKAAAPNGELTKEGFDSIADKWEQKAKQNITLAEKNFEDLQNNRMTIRRNVSPENSSDTSDDWSDIGQLVQ